MKVLAINGSPKKKGNTFHALKMIGDVLEKHGVEVEYIQLGELQLKHCIACNGCVKNRDRKCVLGEDGLNGIIEKMAAADGLLLGSPTYFSNVSSSMKAFLDRAFYVCGCNGGLMRHKVGAAVSAVRRAGGIPALDTMHRYFTYGEMFTVGANYWPSIFGNVPGEVQQDVEGVCALTLMGENMAWLLQAVEQQKIQNPLPEPVRKPYMNFIR